MQPIFVTGFERSGTTMLRRLISMHPDLEYDLIHEGRKLLSYKTPQEALNNYKDGYAHIKAGEKMPFYNNVKFVQDYIKQWRSWWPDSLIFHIVRSPDTVAESCFRTFKRNRTNTLKAYEKTVPEIIKFSKYYEMILVPYDALIINPKMYLCRIYGYMGNIPDDDYLDKVLTTQEPWEHEGRRMCGLRYKKKVK